jgi:glutathione peroxidase
MSFFDLSAHTLDGTSQSLSAYRGKVLYGVTFPLFEKVSTKGPGQSPVYAFLTKVHGEPRWNFHKYLVGKDGEVVAAFSSKVTPESAELRTAIDQALAEYRGPSQRRPVAR